MIEYLFLTIVAALLLRRLYINCKLTGAVAFDIVLSAALLFAVLWRLCLFATVQPLWLGVFILIGASSASLERFCVGYAFHRYPAIEEWHEAFHEQLRRRKVTKQYLLGDHLSELVSYAVLFTAYYTVWCWLPFAAPDSVRLGWWLGLLAEHYVGAEFRLHVQYSDAARWEKSMFRRFYHNLEAYYWYHVVVNRQRCLGFSTPFWDTLAGRNPFLSRCRFSTPLPFVDFLFVNYETDYEQVQRHLALYRAKLRYPAPTAS